MCKNSMLIQKEKNGYFCSKLSKHVLSLGLHHALRTKIIETILEKFLFVNGTFERRSFLRAGGVM